MAVSRTTFLSYLILLQFALLMPLIRCDDVRMNQVQVVGTHNSYHVETPESMREAHRSLLRLFESPKKYQYSHAPLDEQLEHQLVRGLELDVWADPEGGAFANPQVARKAGVDFVSEHPQMVLPGTKILHKANVDVTNTCYTLVECLVELRNWSAHHPQHAPIPVILEFKHGRHFEPWTTENMDSLDAEIRSVFPAEKLVTPDNVRQPGFTLEQSVLQYGWPTLESSRGKFFFLMDNRPIQDPKIRQAYRARGRDNLEGRIVFTNSNPGQPDAAFVKRNEPISKRNIREIQNLVREGYYVRTRADTPTSTGPKANRYGRQHAAFQSGAQLVSTDYPAPGMAQKMWNSDYFCQLNGAIAVRCNPVNGPIGCLDETLEQL